MNRKWFFGILANAMCSLFLASTANAEVIGLNFSGGVTGSSSSPIQMTAAQTAGVVSTANWTNLDNSSGTVSNLKNDNAIATTASVSWSCNGIYATNINGTDGDSTMMKGHLDARATGDATVTVSNLPTSLTANGYNVYVYFDAITNTGQVITGYTIGSQTFWTKDTGTFDGTYIQATATDRATVADTGYTTFTNYARFTNLTDSGFTLAADSDTFRAEVAGIQIVSVPEPGTLAILVTGLIGLIVWRRKR